MKVTSLRRNYGANDLSAWSPNFWANESLMVLDEALFAPKLCHRDFEPLVAEKGDVVKTRRPNTFTFNRKSDSDSSVSVQDLSTTNVNVPLDQHIEVSFKVRDVEFSKGMKNLIETHIKPAATEIARTADKIIFGQVHQFLGNGVGKLGGMIDTNAKDYILWLRERMNNKKVPDAGRHLVLNNYADMTVLRPEWFTSVDKAGDSMGLKEAWIGRKLGFDFMRSNNMPTILGGNTQLDPDTLVNNAAGYPAGTTVITIDGNAGDAYTDGVWVTVDGLPNIVTASTATSMTLRWPLTRAIADNAPIFGYTAAAVNFGAGYAAGYDKEIVIDGTTVALQVGQAVTFGTASPGSTAIYTVLKVTGLTGITLDRPLEAALVDNDTVNIGPPGNFSLAFHRNALTFVNRPLALPSAELGAKASVVTSDNGISMRVIMQYNALGQYTLVTFDMLCGVKILDTDLGAVLLS